MENVLHQINIVSKTFFEVNYMLSNLISYRY